MAKAIEDLLARMKSSPADVRFVDACKVANHFFGPPRQNGTSHRVWKMPWPGDPRINLQQSKGGKAKAYQVRQMIVAIERLNQVTASVTSTSISNITTEEDHAPSDTRG